MTTDSIFQFLVRAMVLFTMMPVHECAHGLAADRLGDDTPRVQGRLTLNPFAHLDLTGSLLLFFTGFGWAKPVMVDTRNFKHPRRDMALTALAGPLSNIILSFIILIIFNLILVISPAMRTSSSVNALANILGRMSFINVSLAVFNLLPMPPLDGSKIFAMFLPEKLYEGMLRYQGQIAIVIMILLFFGILSTPIMWASIQVFKFLNLLVSPIQMLL